MPRIPESAQPAGLRRLAIGGVGVTSAFGQIRQNLEAELGPGAGLFLAEPAERGDKTDWYTDAQGPARRLADLDEPERRRAGERLREALGGISAFAERLKSDKDEYRSHLGNLIELAIQIPDESHVWMVGDQPVLTFWGTTREVGQPVESPAYRLVPPPALPAADTEGAAAAASGSDEAAEPAASAAETGVAVLRREERIGGGALLLLWLLLAVILFAIGFQLLRSCALALPWLPAPLVSFCAAPEGETGLVGLLGERERLETGRRLLMDQVERERRMCVAESAPPEPAPPAPPSPAPAPPAPPPPSPNPPQPGRAAFAGCWGTHGTPVSLTIAPPAGSTEQPVSRPMDIFFCVEPTLDRGRIVWHIGDAPPCGAGLSAAPDADKIALHYDRFACGTLTLSPADIACGRQGEDALLCSLREYDGNGQPKPESDRVSDVNFMRMETMPQ